MAKRRQKQQNNSPKRKIRKTNAQQPKETEAVLANGGVATPELVSEPAPKRAHGFECVALQDASEAARPMQQQAAPEHAQSDDLVALHRVRFVPWKPAPGVGTAATSDGSLLAILRENGGIEVWDTAAWVGLLTIPSFEDACPTCVTWAQDPTDGAPRLFTGSLDGMLTEWDLGTRRARHVGDSYGGAVWAMGTEPAGQVQEGAAPRVAVACEDGVLRIFVAEGGSPGLAYARSMPALGDRLLSVAWHPSGQSVLVGTAAGTLHVWHLSSGRESMRINVGDGAAKNKKKPAVWAAAVLADGTMVSGDGAGGVQFWDARLGTRLAGFAQHEADVLALAAAPDGDAVFAAGIDPQVAMFQRVPGKKGHPDRWVYTESKRMHTHDVRSLTVATFPGEGSPSLISVGNDARFLVHSVPDFAKEHPMQVCGTPQPPLLALGPRASAPHLMSAQGTEVDIWRLGQAVDRKAATLSGWGWAEGSPVDVAAEPRHLANISLKGGEHISAAALSADGTSIAVGRLGMGSLRLFRLSTQEVSEDVSLDRADVPEKLPGAAALAFSHSGHRLLLATVDARLLVLDLQNREVVATLTDAAREPTATPRGGIAGSSNDDDSGGTAAERLHSQVTQLHVSPDDKWAMLVTPGTVHVFDLDGLAYHGRLPLFEDGDLVTAATFGPAGDVIALVSASMDVAVFDVALLRATAWTLANGPRVAQLPQLRLLQGTVAGISFCPDAKVKSAVLYTETSLCHVDFDAPVPLNGKRKRRRSRSKLPEEASYSGNNFRLLPLENPCLLCAFTSSSTALLVEKAWSEVMKEFPQPLYRRRYGT